MKNDLSVDRASRIAEFNPGYTWPNPAFPFRHYLDHPKCRIFLIECFTHNWNWLSKYYEGIRPTDIFLVTAGWDQTGSLSKSARKMLDVLGLDPEQFIVLANSLAEIDAFNALGIPAVHINNNAWIDWDGPMRPMQLEKIYNAIYVGRLVPFKRHHLAAKVASLAVVAGNPYQSAPIQPPPNAYINEKPLPRVDVAKKINQSHVGLLLSEVEGACYASSEYLLCGIPVVSTPSRGGRDAWYNEYNSLVVDPTPEAVAEGVDYFLTHPRSPERIRAMHIEMMVEHRRRFIELLRNLFFRYGVTDIEPDQYFKDKYFEKMKKSTHVDFESLFGN